MDQVLLFEIGLIAVLISALLAWFLWRHLRRRSRESWPMMNATVEGGHILVQSKATPVFVLVLGYSYSVDGSYFSGNTAVATTDYGDAEWLVPQLGGLRLTIRYDPTHPENSFPIDTRLGDHALLTKSDFSGKWTVVTFAASRND